MDGSLQSTRPCNSPHTGLEATTRSGRVSDALGIRVARPDLPSRDVSAATIEDAYVRFILHCNPAVPSDASTQDLREAFWRMPSTGGQTFNTHALYELTMKFMNKNQAEIKTWAELVECLGVGHVKGRSAQMVPQYGARLKRWMRSMHIDAFFGYLAGCANPYWTEIPAGDDAVCEEGRDGVMANDDLALRALITTLRPRRGRKRLSESQDTKTPPPSQRLTADRRTTPHAASGSHPDGGRAPLYAGFGRPAPWSPLEPTSAAATPTTAWADAEPPIGPLAKNKAKRIREPPKALSSAGMASAPNGKPRGPPPHAAGIFSTFPGEQTPGRAVFSMPTPSQEDAPAPRTNVPAPQRLATQQPTVPGGKNAAPKDKDASAGFFKAMPDQTNLEGLQEVFVRKTLRADWFDSDGRPTEPCSVEEAENLFHVTIESLWRSCGGCNKAFLLKLAAMIGGRTLLATSRSRVTKHTESDVSRYRFDWEYGLGGLRSHYSFTEEVRHVPESGGAEQQQQQQQQQKQQQQQQQLQQENMPADGAEGWRRKCQELQRVVSSKDKQIQDLKSKLFSSVQM